MRNKVYWGLGVLIVLFIAVFVLVMVNQHAEIKQLEAEAKKAEDKANQMKDTPPVAREGHKMVPHGDHWHEVPISENPVFQDAPVSQPAVPETKSKPKTHTGALPYTTPLLETDPVEALRQQSADRGHWSAQWIPTFPPDDTEALTMARDVFIMVAHVSRGNKYYDGPAASAWENVDAMKDKYLYIYGQRSDDIFRLTWPLLDETYHTSISPETFGITGWKIKMERQRQMRGRNR